MSAAPADKAYGRVVNRRIHPVLKLWKERLGLELWIFKHETVIGSIKGHREAQATVICDWRYMEAFFTWCGTQIIDMDDRELELVVLHELAHVLVCHTRAEPRSVTDGEEHAATIVALALRFTADACEAAGLKRGKALPRRKRR